MSLTITSTAFAPDGAIPSVYTCEGKDISPPLAWSGAPAGTKSFALIVDDPDAPDPAAPKMTWVHWVLYDIPPAASTLPEAVQASALPSGTREGVNDWGRADYGGPCPPHRPSPVLTQALRARHRPRGSQAPEKSRAGEGDAGTHPRAGGVDRHVPETQIAAACTA